MPTVSIPVISSSTDVVKITLADLAVHNLAAAELEIDRLIAESGADARFGVIRIELEPNSQMAGLPAADFARLAAGIAQVLRALLRPGDKIFSDHGWTWLLVLPKLVSPTHLTLALIKLQHGLDDHRNLSALQQVPLMPVLGGAFYPDSAHDAHGLLAMARMASFESWRSGKRFRVGMPVEDFDARRTTELAKRIPSALRDDLLEIYLQPQVATRTGECVSVEVLLRWQDVDNDWIPSPQIIAAIEQAGLRPLFNRWLIQSTLRCLKELDAQGVTVDYSVNMTAADIHDPEFVDVVSQALETWDVDSGRITLEITETALVRETAETQENLRRLKRLGVRFSLDDFGTAYATMSYLRSMPVDELKIDLCFIQRMTESEKDREIVTSMIRLAHQLNIEVVAEGVEREETLVALRSLGCDLIQGHYFSQPLAPQAFAQWWSSRLPLAAP